MTPEEQQQYERTQRVALVMVWIGVAMLGLGLAMRVWRLL